MPTKPDLGVDVKELAQRAGSLTRSATRSRELQAATDTCRGGDVPSTRLTDADEGTCFLRLRDAIDETADAAGNTVGMADRMAQDLSTTLTNVATLFTQVEESLSARAGGAS